MKMCSFAPEIYRTMEQKFSERYDLLMPRCSGIVEHLDLQDIASFLNVTPQTISKIRKEITFGNY